MTGGFRRAHVLVEGQTEEIVVNQLLSPHLAECGWWVSVSLVKTKRPAGGPSHKGGVASWGQVEREVRLLLRDSSLNRPTTLFDYYAFPENAPGMADRPKGPNKRAQVEHVERALAEWSADRRFRPHLVLHELETWVFAAPDQVECLLGAEVAERLRADVLAAGGPEGVNDGRETAPSNRLLDYCPAYGKTNDGPMILTDLGLPALRAQCPHLDAWLDEFER